MFNQGDVVVVLHKEPRGYYNVMVVVTDDGEFVHGPSIAVRDDGKVYNITYDSVALTAECDLLLASVAPSLLAAPAEGGE